jgi:O-antigen ligase
VKETSAISVPLEEKISYWHMVAFVVMLPFDRIYTEIILISLLVHTLLHAKRSDFKKLFTVNSLAVSGAFLVGLIAMLWSEDRHQGLKDLQRQLALVIVPFIFIIGRFDLAKWRRSLLMIFMAGISLTVIYLYIDAFRIISYNHLPLKSIVSAAFINHNFSQPIEMHATYLSMYAALALIAALQYLVESGRRSEQVLYMITLLVLSAGIFQLASRAVWIAVVVYLFIYIVFFCVKGWKRNALATFSVTALVLVMIAVNQIDSFRHRYVVALKDDLTQSSLNNEILEPRYARWKAALTLVTTAPVIGHGYGSEKKLLKNLYYEKRLFNSYLLELNAHNQYLSMLLKTGLAGLLFYLWILAYGLSEAWLRLDNLLLGFMLLITILSFSENLLDVNKGIFFFAFFFSLFLQTGKPRNQNSRFEIEK